MTKQYIKYIYNHIIFTVIIWLCVFVGGINADTNVDYGIYHQTQSGIAEHTYKWNNNSGNADVDFYVDYKWTDMNGGAVWFWNRAYIVENPSSGGTDELYYGNTIYWAYQGFIRDTKESSSFHNMALNDGIHITRLRHSSQSWIYYQQGHTLYFYPTGIDKYSVSGTTCGVNSVTLQIKDGASYYTMNYTTLTSAGDSYSFPIINNTQYRIEFSDTHIYDFTCADNVIYNYDLCDWQIIHYVDDCANFLKNPCINIIVNDDYANPLIEDGTSHTDLFLVGTDIQINDKLDIWIGTDQGEQFRTIYAEIGEDWLYHSYKSWDLDITVYDINTSACVPNAKVSINQDCRINDYPPHTYGITNLYGYVKTFDLSNQPYQVKVEKENYNTFGYTTINAGFDAQHTNVPLTIYIQDTTKGDGNGTIGEPPNGGGGGGNDTVLPQTPCSILWTDNNNKSITEINDTQEAKLYFMAGNCSTMLYMERWNTAWIIEDSMLLTPLQTGYAHITPANWHTQDKTTIYRGRLWAYSCACDAISQLKVWNVSDDNITIFENLTCNAHFRHKIGGQYINPNTPISILSYAASNNTTLLNIDLKLYNETTLIDTISYTFFDYYTSGSFNPIEWKPNYDYATGFNYTIRMYGIGGALLDIDTVYANATGDNPFDTGNALTVKVYDHNTLPLQYSTVYVESWGSIDTGATNEVIFTGLGDDTYEYRAIKSGYLDRGFQSVTLSVDTTVSYILDIIDTEHAIRDIRMSDMDIKAMLYPIVFFILIMLLIGVLIDAVN